MMESICKYMENNNYLFSGELNFNRDGESIPPQKLPWVVHYRQNRQ